ncbi:MAG: hypothetical protein LQ350_006658 [Teloschistes chrysophthalmus]|nr:MAG: hypothetical protein LQ350_006658 [Niorma chrysophthalma]
MRTTNQFPDYDSAGTILTTCNDGSYCCGYNNNECCSEGAGIKINKKGQILAKGQITSSIAAATSTSTPTPSSTDSQRTSSSSTSSSATGTQTAGAVNANPSLPSPTPASSGGLSGGAKAGIAIGCVAGAALVAGLLYLLYRERRKSRALQGAAHHAGAQAYVNNNNNENKFKPAYGGGAAAGGYGGAEVPPQEMGSYDQAKWQFRGEMDGGQGVPQELPGGANAGHRYVK